MFFLNTQDAITMTRTPNQQTWFSTLYWPSTFFLLNFYKQKTSFSPLELKRRYCVSKLILKNVFMVFFQYWVFFKNRLKIPKILNEKIGQFPIWPQIFFKKEFLNSEIWATLLIFLKRRIRVSKFKSEKGKLVFGPKWSFFSKLSLGQKGPK